MIIFIRTTVQLDDYGFRRGEAAARSAHEGDFAVAAEAEDCAGKAMN